MPRKKITPPTSFAINFASMKSAMAELRTATPTHVALNCISPQVLEVLKPAFIDGFANEQIISVLRQYEAGDDEGLAALVVAARRLIEEAEANRGVAKNGNSVFAGLESIARSATQTSATAKGRSMAKTTASSCSQASTDAQADAGSNPEIPPAQSASDAPVEDKRAETASSSKASPSDAAVKTCASPQSSLAGALTSKQWAAPRSPRRKLQKLSSKN